MRRLADVNAYVIVDSLDPVYGVGGDQNVPAIDSNRQPLGIARDFHLLDEPSELRRVDRSFRGCEVCLCARDRLQQPITRDRLEHVIDGMHIERLERVRVVRGDEDYHWNLSRIELLRRR